REPNDDVSTAQEVAIPGAIDGRFERERDRDYFVLRGEPRARVELRGITGERGSPADLLLSILDANGKASRRVDDADGGGEARVTIDLDESGRAFLRVEDLVERGGPNLVYRIEVERTRGSFELSLEDATAQAPRGGWIGVTVRSRRHGFDGPITLAIEGLDGAAELEGAEIPKGKDETRLRVRVPPELEPGTLRLVRIVGRATEDGETIESRASLWPAWKKRFPRLERAPLALEHELAIAIGPPAPPLFALELPSEEVVLERGGEARIDVRATERAERFEGAIALRVEQLPPGVRSEKAEVPQKGDKATVILKAANDAELGSR